MLRRTNSGNKRRRVNANRKMRLLGRVERGGWLTVGYSSEGYFGRVVFFAFMSHE